MSTVAERVADTAAGRERGSRGLFGLALIGAIVVVEAGWLGFLGYVLTAQLGW